MGFHPCNSVKSVSGLAPMPFGNSRDESQRDSAPKPRVASRELPWEKRVVSANPNGVVARWRRWDTTPLGLKIARTLTQGSLADSVAGLEDTIPLGLQSHRALRRSIRHWPRTEYPKGIGASGAVDAAAEMSYVGMVLADEMSRRSSLQLCRWFGVSPAPLPAWRPAPGPRQPSTRHFHATGVEFTSFGSP